MRLTRPVFFLVVSCLLALPVAPAAAARRTVNVDGPWVAAHLLDYKSDAEEPSGSWLRHYWARLRACCRRSARALQSDGVTPTQIVAALPSVPPPIRAALDAAIEGWVASLGPRLVSIVLFGSVARGPTRLPAPTRRA